MDDHSPKRGIRKNAHFVVRLNLGVDKMQCGFFGDDDSSHTVSVSIQKEDKFPVHSCFNFTGRWKLCFFQHFFDLLFRYGRFYRSGKKVFFEISDFLELAVVIQDEIIFG